MRYLNKLFVYEKRFAYIHAGLSDFMYRYYTSALIRSDLIGIFALIVRYNLFKAAPARFI